MTKDEICKADSKLQYDYNHGIISLGEWNFAKELLKDEWVRVTRERELLERLREKYGQF